MKTLNESLIEEFDEIIEEFDFSKEDKQDVDKEKLKRIYKELLNHKDDNQDFEKSARTIVNTVLNKEFGS